MCKKIGGELVTQQPESVDVQIDVSEMSDEAYEALRDQNPDTPICAAGTFGCAGDSSFENPICSGCHREIDT